MGVAGDMLMASLSELADADAFTRKMNSLGLSGIEIGLDEIKRSGIVGTKANVLINGVEEGVDGHHHEHHHHERHHEHHHEGGHEHNGHHSHSSMKDVESIINGLDLSDKVKSDAIEVYNRIAKAESTVHGTSVSEIHFHEVGTMDAIADVVGVCLLMNMISPDRIIASSINVGSGMVKCAHGILPVPAPATALLLRDVPMYTDSKIESELCTPTGAALVSYFADGFRSMPDMTTDKIGYGFGTKTFEEDGRLNCVRTFLGEQQEDVTRGSENNQRTVSSNNTVIELRCNVDDMTSEDIGYATQMLMSSGANDVFVTPIYMKKNRPGMLITVICDEKNRDVMVEGLFKYTTTIGVRETICNRYVLDRTEIVRNTKYGDVRFKEVEGFGVKRSKPEYEDIARIAEENNLDPKTIRDSI